MKKPPNENESNYETFTTHAKLMSDRTMSGLEAEWLSKKFAEVISYMLETNAKWIAYVSPLPEDEEWSNNEAFLLFSIRNGKEIIMERIDNLLEKTEDDPDFFAPDVPEEEAQE